MEQRRAPTTTVGFGCGFYDVLWKAFALCRLPTELTFVFFFVSHLSPRTRADEYNQKYRQTWFTTRRVSRTREQFEKLPWHYVQSVMIVLPVSTPLSIEYPLALIFPVPSIRSLVRVFKDRSSAMNCTCSIDLSIFSVWSCHSQSVIHSARMSFNAQEMPFCGCCCCFCFLCN